MKRKIIAVITIVVLISVLQTSFIADAKVYSDTQSHWARTYIDKMTSLSIMDSTSSTYFYPGNYFKRKDAAKSATMMYREAEMPASPHPFTDVPYSNSYSKYVKWMYDHGVMAGTDSTTFSPEAYIKRQDFCVVMYNLIKWIGLPYVRYESKVTYTDDSQISSYAKTAVYEMQRLNVITEGGAFRPKDYITRAEAAVMLYKVWEVGLVLRMPPSIQQKSNWCWAACAEMVAEYRRPNSRNQSAIVTHIKGSTVNDTASYTERAQATTYATYNEINFIGMGTTRIYSTLRTHLSEYRPLSLGFGKYENNVRTSGHAMVCLGYVKVGSNANNNKIFIYDVNDGQYYWFTYYELLNGTREHWEDYKYDNTVYSNS